MNKFKSLLESFKESYDNVRIEISTRNHLIHFFVIIFLNYISRECNLWFRIVGTTRITHVLLYSMIQWQLMLACMSIYLMNDEMEKKYVVFRSQKSHLFKYYFKRNDKCAICLTRNKKLKSVMFKECKHGFHKKCIYDWINNHTTNCFVCPCCRKQYFTKPISMNV